MTDELQAAEAEARDFTEIETTIYHAFEPFDPWDGSHEGVVEAAHEIWDFIKRREAAIRATEAARYQSFGILHAGIQNMMEALALGPDPSTDQTEETLRQDLWALGANTLARAALAENPAPAARYRSADAASKQQAILDVLRDPELGSNESLADELLDLFDQWARDEAARYRDEAMVSRAAVVGLLADLGDALETGDVLRATAIVEVHRAALAVITEPVDG